MALNTSKMIDQFVNLPKISGLDLSEPSCWRKLAGFPDDGVLQQLMGGISVGSLSESVLGMGQVASAANMMGHVATSVHTNFQNVGSVYRVFEPINSWVDQTQTIQELIQQSIGTSAVEGLKRVTGIVSTVSTMAEYGSYFEKLTDASRIISSNYFINLGFEDENAPEPQALIEEAAELRQQVGPEIFDELAAQVKSDDITIPLSWSASAWWENRSPGQQKVLKVLLVGAIYLTVLVSVLMGQTEFPAVELFMETAGISPHGIAASAAGLVGGGLLIKNLSRKPDVVYYRRHPIDKRIRQRVEIWNEDADS